MIQSTSKKNNVQQKIYSFLLFKPGWHFGEGVAPSHEVAEHALAIVEQASFYGLDTDAFPGIDGEIMVTVYHDNDYLEFTTESDTTVTFVHERKKRQISYKEQLPLNVALDEIRRIGEKLWNISDLFTKNILIPKDRSSRAWRLGILPGQAYQSYQKIVSHPWDITYALTSKNTTEGFRPSRLSTGYSQYEIYPEDVSSGNIQVIPGTNAIGT